MILETSALLAMLLDEPDAEAYQRAIDAASTRRISAGTLLETCIVVDGNGDAVAGRLLDNLLAAAGVAVEPVTVEQVRIARAAYRDFGRGSGHPARLNFGDCFAYALARATGEPLLFKGEDFAQTDLRSALT